MKKNFIYFFLFFIFILLIFNNDSFFNFVKKNLPSNFKHHIKKKIFAEQLDKFDQMNFILYNQHFLPSTQFEDIEFEKISLEFIKTNKMGYHKNSVKKFLFEKYDNNLYIISKKNIYKFQNFKFHKNIKISTNLKNFNIDDTLDISKVGKYIFISVNEKKSNSECGNLKILYSEINDEFLQFKNFYTFKECLINIVGGRIKEYNFNNTRGFLITTGSYGEDNSFLSQNDNSNYGKIIFFDLKKKNPIIFSKGHRNPQGLFVEGNLILSTEHGDYGGDEINNIVYKKNYGYPISSYGDLYSFREKILPERKNFNFLKNHKKKNFEEPIFAFIPSIGISEIVKLPNTFSKYWQNNYLISSLNARSLYRVKFDLDHKKILYMEKIYIGERIRDIIVDNEDNKIYLALENSGSIGIINIKNN